MIGIVSILQALAQIVGVASDQVLIEEMKNGITTQEVGTRSVEGVEVSMLLRVEQVSASVVRDEINSPSFSTQLSGKFS